MNVTTLLEFDGSCSQLLPRHNQIAFNALKPSDPGIEAATNPLGPARVQRSLAGALFGALAEGNMA
jgi:hypothetical protein